MSVAEKHGMFLKMKEKEFFVKVYPIVLLRKILRTAQNFNALVRLAKFLKLKRSLKQMMTRVAILMVQGSKCQLLNFEHRTKN